MSNSWQTFIEPYPVKALDTDALADRAAICDLSHLGLLKVSGKDAEPFLQGQLTNDVKQLIEGHSHLSAYCTAKGRMLAIFRAFRCDDAFYLQTNAEIIDPVQKRLQMFILMAKVKLENVSDQLPHFGLMGDAATALLQAHFPALSTAENSFIHNDEITLIRHPGATARYQIIAPLEALKTLWSQVADEADVVNPQSWALFDIRAGIPNLYPATQEAFIPQMTNLHLIDGVSFTKGCYVGQEIIARMHYLGKQKRHMVPASVTAEQPPKAGDPLFSPGSHSGQGAGVVVDAQPVGDQYELLIVVEDESAANNDLQLAENGPKLEIGQPPYPLSDTTSTE